MGAGQGLVQTLTSEGTPTSPKAPQGPFPRPWKQRAARLTWDELLNCPAPTHRANSQPCGDSTAVGMAPLLSACCPPRHRSKGPHAAITATEGLGSRSPLCQLGEQHLRTSCLREGQGWSS